MLRPGSLKKLTFVLMTFVVVLQSLSLIFALAFSQVFYILDAESFRLFHDNVASRAVTFNKMIGELMTNVAIEAESVEQGIRILETQDNISAHEVYANDTAYIKAAEMFTNSVLDLLRKNNVTGAFVVLNHSNLHKDQPNEHSAVYIRNSTPDIVMANHTNYIMEMGPAELSEKHQIAKSINWDVSMGILPAMQQYNFYTKPMSMAQTPQLLSNQMLGYWSAPAPLLPDNQKVICYSVPLMDAQGVAYGVLGVEISQYYFSQKYLPYSDIPYQNSFYAVSSTEDSAINLDWVIPSGPLAELYLQPSTVLKLQSVVDNNVKLTTVPGIGDMYCTMHDLQLYDRNSPYSSQRWCLVGYVDRSVLHETSARVQKILGLSILITTITSLVVIVFLTQVSTRDITALSQYIRGIKPDSEVVFKKTGLKEIDELTNAIELFNRNVINTAKSISKVMELTNMPMGCFEALRDAKYVFVSKYIYDLLGQENDGIMTKEKWQQVYGLLTQQQEPGYENVYYFTTKHGGGKWLRMLEAKTEDSLVGVIMDVSEDIEKARRLEYELDFDALTRLYSRQAFKRKAMQAIESNPDKIGALIFADLDNLKYINDNFGHDLGDRYIVKAGEMFNQFSRYGGIVARISGDEFAIFLHGFASKTTVQKLAQDLFNNQCFYMATPDNKTHRIRCSAGIAWYPQDSTEIADLLKLADFAMYEAKNTMKGTVFEFNKDSYAKNFYLLEKREAINRIIDEKLIRFAFQPIVDLKTGEVFAYEALMRSLLEDFSSPLEIIAVATAQSKLNQIETLTLNTVLAYLAANRSQFAGKKLFINSLPNQQISTADIELYQSKHPSLFSQIVFEITENENVALASIEQKVATMRELGAQIAIDDFGSGYSNELRILSIDPDMIKIDMEIIRNIHKNVDKQRLVSNIVSFCKSKGVRTIAEGVETAQELETAVWLGIDYVQGYFVAKPHFELMPIISEKVRLIRSLAKKYPQE